MVPSNYLLAAPGKARPMLSFANGQGRLAMSVVAIVDLRNRCQKLSGMLAKQNSFFKRLFGCFAFRTSECQDPSRNSPEKNCKGPTGKRLLPSQQPERASGASQREEEDYEHSVAWSVYCPCDCCAPIGAPIRPGIVCAFHGSSLVISQGCFSSTVWLSFMQCTMMAVCGLTFRLCGAGVNMFRSNSCVAPGVRHEPVVRRGF